MFELDEKCTNTACIVKVAGIGKVGTLLEKYVANTDIALLTGNSAEPEAWTGTDLGFLVADDTENNAWERLQQGIHSARQQNVLPVPIWITKTKPDTTDTIMALAPQHFTSDEDIYKYIVESISSIQSLLSLPGLVNLDLEDVRQTFSGAGRLAFSYGEYAANTDKQIAVDEVMQRLSRMDVAPHSSKFMLLNITGSEEHLSMFEIAEISELIYDKLGTNDCHMIWGANIDNAFADKIRISLWVRQ